MHATTDAATWNLPTLPPPTPSTFHSGSLVLLHTFRHITAFPTTLPITLPIYLKKACYLPRTPAYTRLRHTPPAVPRACWLAPLTDTYHHHHLLERRHFIVEQDIQGVPWTF